MFIQILHLGLLAFFLYDSFVRISEWVSMKTLYKDFRNKKRSFISGSTLILYLSKSWTIYCWHKSSVDKYAMVLGVLALIGLFLSSNLYWFLPFVFLFVLNWYLFDRSRVLLIRIDRYLAENKELHKELIGMDIRINDLK